MKFKIKLIVDAQVFKLPHDEFTVKEISALPSECVESRNVEWRCNKIKETIRKLIKCCVKWSLFKLIWTYKA